MTPNVQTYKPAAPWSAAGFAPGTGAPTRVVVHRTANPDANGLGTMGYFDRSREASIHIVIDGSEVLLGVPWDRHAWHVKASQRAAALGFATSHPNVQGGRSRGDIHAIGIEVVERWIAEPLVGRGDPRRDAIIRSGEGIWWPDETVETLHMGTPRVPPVRGGRPPDEHALGARPGHAVARPGRDHATVRPASPAR